MAGGHYTVGAVEWTTTGPVDTAVRASNISVNASPELSVDDSGSVYDEAASLMRWTPTASFSTKALENILGVFGLDGTCVGTGQTVLSMQFYARKLKTCVDVVASNSHIKYGFDKGLLRLGTLSADRNADAMISCDFDAYTTVPGTDPLTITDGATLPTIAGSSRRFRLHGVMINSVPLPRVTGVEISYNVSITEKEPDLGSIYPRAVGVLQVQPVITIRGADPSDITSAGLLPGKVTVATHGNAMIELVCMQDSASYYSTAQSEHIRLTYNGLCVPSEVYSAATGQRAQNQFSIRCLHDGTNVPIVTTINTTI